MCFEPNSHLKNVCVSALLQYMGFLWVIAEQLPMNYPEKTHDYFWTGWLM